VFVRRETRDLMVRIHFVAVIGCRVFRHRLRLNHLPITSLEIPIQYIFYVTIARLERASFFHSCFIVCSHIFPPGTRARRTLYFPQDRYVEFRIDIDPTSLATRILSVREQIADEWVADLETLRVSNDMILESYNNKLKEAREEENCDEESYENRECTISAENRPKVFAFERNAQYFVRNTMAFNDRASSMLRQGNFDLLALLATQESVHRVLRDYADAGSEREVSFQWFREFYVARVAKFFDGNKEHGSSDDFLEELLLSPPTFSADETGKMGLVDPLRIAEDILATRSKVAVEWRKIAMDTKDEHVTVRKELLEKQMVKWGQRPAAKPTETVAASMDVAPTEQQIFGEFQ
jgi:hypothetical protein